MTKPKKKPDDSTIDKKKKPPKPTKPKALTADEKKVLFVGYDKASTVFDKATAALTKAAEGKSIAVKAIADALGTGPFKWKGTQLNVVCRKGSDDKPSVFYFKSPTRADIEEIG